MVAYDKTLQKTPQEMIERLERARMYGENFPYHPEALNQGSIYGCLYFKLVSDICSIIYRVRDTVGSLISVFYPNSWNSAPKKIQQISMVDASANAIFMEYRRSKPDIMPETIMHLWDVGELMPCG